jgi:putative transcriptional regulator
MPAPLQKGTLLAASQDLQEDYFARSVILIIHHSTEDGSMGLVLNRPMGENVQIDYSDELSSIAESVPNEEGISRLFFEGGPVDRSYLFYLHRLSHIIADGNPVLEDLHWGGDLDAVRAEPEVVAADEPLLRFYLGYAGWEQGQLEREIELGAWMLVPGDVDQIFTHHTESMWHDVVHSLGGKYRAIAELPVDPSVN